ncbi:hypothetical protein BH23ACT10_BH23ACT10_37320 [soil metagenome]
MEKWILRILVSGLLAVGAMAVAASVDDIKRYVKIRQM